MTQIGTCNYYHPIKMQDFIIEPDPGQSVTIEVDDPGDFLWMAYQWNQPVFIGETHVYIEHYRKLETLGYVSGHRVQLVIKGT